MFERHTGEVMLKLITDFLDVVCPSWRSKLVSVSTDGASSMTGPSKGVVTRLEKEALHKIYRVWCGIHQLDLVMKHAYKNVMDGEFNKIMFQLTGYLRHQFNLISEMQTTCPKATTTRWTAMGIACNWLIVNRVAMLQYIAKDDPTQAPPNWWWIVVSSINAISEYVNFTMIKLQAEKLLISQQRQELDHLSATLSAWIVIEPNDVELHNATSHYISGRWAVSYQNVVNYIFDRGIFIQDIYNGLSVELQAQVITIVSKLVIGIVDGIVDIQAERDSTNLPSAEQFPPVLPHELIKLPTREFTSIVVQHLDRLKQFWSEKMIDILEREHQQLLIKYQRDTTLKSAIDNCDNSTSFEVAWSIVETKKLKVLRDFCGGIASIFPNTATVESDFSILGWEKDEYRKSLTDLSLEGIIQCKQYELLSGLSS